MTHYLKTWPKQFLRVIEGSKTFDVRKNDRDFQVGDSIRLREWCPDQKKYTGEEITLIITYVLLGGQLGIEEGYVVMGFFNRMPNNNLVTE